MIARVIGSKYPKGGIYVIIGVPGMGRECESVPVAALSPLPVRGRPREFLQLVMVVNDPLALACSNANGVLTRQK